MPQAFPSLPRLRRPRHAAVFAAIVAGSLPAWLAWPPRAALAQPGLPPPPGAALPSQMTLYLELVVNERPSGQVVPVQLRGGRYFVQASILQALNVRTPAAPETLVAVDQIPGVLVQYDSIGQRLKLSVPPDWLPVQDLAGAVGTRPIDAISDTGLLLNYDLFATKPQRGPAVVSVWSEQRMFGRWGTVSNTGVQRLGSAAGADRGYMRYDTRWSHSDAEAIRTLSAGDLITDSLPWGSSVRIGGVQIARNFAIRPDLVTYPLPRFSGQAAVPSAVDLFVNGYKAGSETVQPGPFTLGTVPYINGAGEATVVTTDALGRQVATTVPFYVANTLLKAGTFDYGLSAGALRREYGQSNFSYGPLVASGSLRYGLSDGVTLEGHSEAARQLRLAGAGAVFALGRWGVANAAASQSQLRGVSGSQRSFGYQYSAQRFALSVQRTERSAGYGDLAFYDVSEFKPTREATQLNASASLGAAGAVAAGFFDLLSADNTRTRVLSLSFSRPLGDSMFFSATANKAIGQPGYTLQLQVTVPLDERGTASFTTVRNGDRTTPQVNYSRNAPQSGGLGWSASYSGTGNEAYRQASATWRSPYAQVQGGVYGQSGSNTAWAGAAGSVVWMDGSLFAANRINDAFALVSASGVGGVPIRFENQFLGRTDAAGHLLVPNITGYYPARIEVDPLDLPEYMQAPQPEKRVVVRSGSGALVKFPIERRLAAQIRLVDEAGRPLALGLAVDHVQSGQTTIVGWDGLVYFEDLRGQNELLVRGPGAERCNVQFMLEVDTPQVLRIGPLTCRRLPDGQTALAPAGHSPLQLAAPRVLP